MKLLRTITLSLLAATSVFPAFGGEVAVLRNGFSINFDRKEIKGETTRLYIHGGYVDVPSTEIASFEQAPDDTADIPAVAPAPTDAMPASTQTAETGNLSSNAISAADLDRVVREASSRYRLDPDFVNSVIKAESNFQVRAVSRKGAQGLMQLMPGTAAQLGVSNPFDPKANVEAGTAYLSYLLDLYHDDALKALAAYNAGSHRVDQYHGVPPYMETREYVTKIVRDFNAKKLAQRKTPGSAATSSTNSRQDASPPSKSAVKAKKKTRSSRPQEAGVSKPQKPA